MKKYYFLNYRKEWQGPYKAPLIIAFAISGAIRPETYLWHDELVDDDIKHPKQCIYARKRASEFLPFWLFGSNLKILSNNYLNRIKRKLRRKNSWQRLTEKPIDNIKTLKNVINVELVPSISSIHDFAAPGEFVVRLFYWDSEKKIKNSEYPISLGSDEKPGLKFEIVMAEPPSVGGVYYQESYGLNRRLILKGINESLSVASYSVFDFSTRFPYKPQVLKGRFRQAHVLPNANYENVHNRFLIKIEDDNFISPQEIIEHTGWHLYDHDKFNVHDSPTGLKFRTGGGYTDVVIDSKRYRFYSVWDKLYIIDGIDREDLKDFKQKTESIRIALATLTGKFYGGECYYLTSDNGSFQHIAGIWYEIERSSVLSDRRLIDLRFFRSTFKNQSPDYATKYKAVDRPLSSNVFSSLCTEAWNNDMMRHAIELIVSGMGNIDPLQQGALYSVALEALTEELGNTKSENLKPIQDKELFKQIKADFLQVLTKYSGNITEEGRNILLKKIETLNSPTNRDKLVKTFELYGIDVSEADKQIIDKRNSYLHGRNPLTREKQFELNQISLRLHTLIVALILKSVGYSGHILNLDKYAYLTNEDRLLDIIEKESKGINRLVEGFEKAQKEKHTEGLEKAKLDLLKSLEESIFLNLIRII